MVCKSEGRVDEKSIFSISPNNQKKEEGITISVQSFADPLFLALRIKDGLNEQQLKKTLNISLNIDKIRKAQESLGASGSFFFFSFDHKIAIKTIPNSEVQALLKILPYYYKHIMDNPKSLLSRFYGLFSVEIAGISKINFIMIENTFEQF